MLGRFVKGIKIGTYTDFCRCVNKADLIQIADNLFCDKTGMVYVISDREWVDYMTGKTNEIPTKEEPAADFDVDENELMGILFGRKHSQRDPRRIRKFCNQLADIWESQCPDWRFGQLIMNVLQKDPFYIEDDEIMEIFKKYFHL